MFEDYDRGEKVRKTGMLRARFIIFGAILLISLIALGISKRSKSSLHDKLAKHHEQTTAYFDPEYMINKTGTIVVYSIGYRFTAGGKSYHNYGESEINPTYPRGIVFYNPENPEENELQPIPKEEEYHGTDR